MLTLLGSPRRCCDGITRRETLKAGALSLLASGFTLPNLLAAEARKPITARPGKAKNVLEAFPVLLAAVVARHLLKIFLIIL